MSDETSRRESLRARLKQQRISLSSDDVSAFSNRICQRALTLLTHHKQIGTYYSVGSEVSLATLMQVCEQSGKQCFVPVVEPEFRMRFAPVNSNTTLISNQYGITEPDVPADKLIAGTLLDAVLVPLVGFDERCNRMGMGGGYYDRCFAARINQPGINKPLLIGVAFEVQHTTDVYAQDWDVPLDYVITEERIINRA